MAGDMDPKPVDSTGDRSTKVLGATAMIIVLAIVAMLVAGGVYWWTTRSSSERPQRTLFSGTMADRIDLADGALKGWNVVLISTDTLRADHLACYGNLRIQTPALDDLARQGVLFRQTVTPAPITLPGHASMLTGLNPPHHGVRSNGFFRLRAETGTLASILKKEGYATGAAIGAFVLDRRFGLNQGFDTYDDDVRGGDRPLQFSYPERRAEKVNDAAIAWLRGHAKEKFFLFVHYYDPHFPYSPPAPFDQQYKTNPYDGEIAYVDSQVKRLVGALDELGVRKRTLVVFTADHGESLSEHGERTHALLIYDATQLVPLIFSAPAPFPKNRIVNHQAGTVDIVPTILSLVGVSVPQGMDGVSLTAKPPSSPRPIYIETLYTRLTHNWAPLLGIRRNDFKFIHAPTPEVYDLKADPRELNNLYESKRALATEMFATLKEMLGADPATAADVKGNLPVDDKTRQMLQGLGYVVPAGTSQPATAAGPLPDPKEMIKAEQMLLDAEEMISLNRWKEAEETIRTYLKISPRDPEGSHIAGQIYRQLGQYDEALTWFTRAASLGYQEAEAFAGIGSIWLVKNDLAKAEEAYRKAFQYDPHCTTALIGMGRIHIERKQEAEALKSYQTALEFGQGLNAGMAYLGMSDLHRRAGRAKEADEMLAKAIDADPTNPAIAKVVSTIYERTGNVGLAIDQLRRAADARPTLEGLLKLGQLLNQQKQYNDAVKYLSMALKLSQANPDVYYELGIALAALNQLDPGAQALAKAMELKPDHIGAHSELGKLLARAGRFDQAEPFLTKAVELDPNSYSAHYNLGLLQANREAWDRAVQSLRKSIQLKGDYAKAHSKLGLIFAQQGKKTEAVKEYREALRIDPNDAEARELLKSEGGS